MAKRQKKSVETAPLASSYPNTAKALDFADKLRSLQNVEVDGLITEDEFQQKRAEILRTKR